MRAAQMKERPGFVLMKQTDIQTIYLNDTNAKAEQPAGISVIPAGRGIYLFCYENTFVNRA